MCPSKSYNVNYPSTDSAYKKSAETDQHCTDSTEHSELTEFIGDLIGCISLFGMLFVGLFVVGLLQ